MQRKINFEVIKIKKKMEPTQVSVIAIKCHRLGKRTASDRNSSKHENSYFELGGPVSTPKFCKLTLERKRSANDVKNKIIEDICLLTSVFEARSVSIADQEILFNVFGWKEIERINQNPTATC